MAAIGLIFNNNDKKEIRNSEGEITQEAIITKIGKVPPNMARALYAYGLSKKTGIFKGYGNECSITAQTTYTSGYDKATVIFDKGLISICGGIIYMEQGTECVIDITSSMANASLGLKVDLSKPEGEEVSFFVKAGNLEKDDLQANDTTGVYEFEIYKINIVANTSLSLGAKTTEYVDSVNDALDAIITSFTSGSRTVKNATNAAQLKYSTSDITPPPDGYLKVYIGQSLPTTRHNGVLYIITQ